ncbi:MAG: dihydrofolate reductase family protein [Pseudonocardia sp.]|nr:dihydrofolate reductase family protein [Pseudonocardia sp.]
MRALTYLVATTLDGFIAAPDGADPSSFWPVTPDYVKHLTESYPETLPGQARAALAIDGPGRQFDTVIEGRRSYEVGLAAGVVDAFPHLRHLVVSTTLETTADPAVELVASDPVTRVRELKEEDGAGVWLVGGASLAASLVEEIDRLVLKIAPMTLGAGIPLWGRDAAALPRAWRPTDRTVLESGVVFAAYEPDSRM